MVLPSAAVTATVCCSAVLTLTADADAILTLIKPYTPTSSCVIYFSVNKVVFSVKEVISVSGLNSESVRRI